MKRLIRNFIDTLNLYGLFAGQTRNTATVYMMHSFSEKPGAANDALDSARLDLYLTYLKEKQYNIISIEDYVQALLDRSDLEKSVVFTIDDGYRDFYLHAFELFRKHDAPATIFLTTDFIDRKLILWWDQIELCLRNSNQPIDELVKLIGGPSSLYHDQDLAATIERVTEYLKELPNTDRLRLIDELTEKSGVDLDGQPSGDYAPLSWDEIKEMQKNDISFYPHSQTHPIMSRLSKEQKLSEISQPRDRLAEMLGIKPDIFCYPNGQESDFDDELTELLKKAGYRAAISAIEGFNDTKSEVDMYSLKRYPIPLDFGMFKQFISGLERFKERFLNRS